GPGDDGEYYSISMRRPYDVFRDIPMSTSMVAQMTIKLAESQGLKVNTLENLFDIDELPDLLRLAQLLEVDSSLAPATAACLATIKEHQQGRISRAGAGDRAGLAPALPRSIYPTMEAFVGTAIRLSPAPTLPRSIYIEP